MTFELAFTSALVDFVWQGTLIAVALQVGLYLSRRRSAQVRYGLSAMALATLIALPVVTTASRYDGAKANRPAGWTGVEFSVVQGNEVRPGTMFDPRHDSALSATRLQPWILPIWTFGVLLLSLRLIAGSVEVRALRRSGQCADDQLRERLSHLAARMGIHRPVQLVTSVRADGPSAIGWLRPLILLPPATAMGLTTAQLDAVLAHELAHIRRHDYLVNIMQMVAETLLFYHPAVWWVSKRLRVERELCCDDEAVRVCGNPTAYARALVTMARQQNPEMAMSASGGSLRERVRRLLGVGGHEPRRSAAFGIAAIAGALVSITFASVHAQPERRRFEVASIKPAAPENRNVGGMAAALVFLPGGTVRGTAVPLRFVITRAYNIQLRNLEGESDLLNERFAIDARAGAGALPPKGATLEQTFLAEGPILREMLKTLLAERFKLAIHVETRDSPIYALVAGPKGHTLMPAVKDCSLKTVDEIAANIGPCGLQGGGPARGFRLSSAPLSSLAQGLTNFMDRPIVDRTGISGRFDIEVPPWSTAAPPRPDSDEPQPDPDGPSIFAALQQLGLRLEPARAPIEYYVIDHVERPTEN
jgi:uncharacterized protein (TIGR03435 family)